MDRSRYDSKEFKRIFTLSESDLFQECYDFLVKSYGANKLTMKKEGYILAEGEDPICLVAHLDTVFSGRKHKETPSREYAGGAFSTLPKKIRRKMEKSHRKNKQKQVKPMTIDEIELDGLVMSSEGRGLGADDRAGVLGIMELINKGCRPHVLFTCGEEVGGIGVGEFVKDHDEFPFDCRYFIELDRQGHGEAVFYHCDNPTFENYIESFGFTTAIGSYSDIVDLSQAYDIAGVNLSIGYLNEHTTSETLNLRSMAYTLAGVELMIADVNTIVIEFSADIKPVTPISSRLYNYNSYDYGHITSSEFDTVTRGEVEFDYDGHNYDYKFDYGTYSGSEYDDYHDYCPECLCSIESTTKFCSECGFKIRKD